MKRIISTFLAAALTVIFSICGYAAEPNGFDCKSYSDFFDANEYAEVIEDISGDYLMTEVNALENRSLMTYNAENGAEVTAYKVYDITSVNFIDELSKGTKISGLLPEKYSWLIPGQNTLVNVIFNEENKWETAWFRDETQKIPNSIVQNDVVQFDVVNSAVENLRLNSSSEVTNVVCVDLVAFRTYFVCVEFTDKTYLIPFGSRPDFTGLENGALYSPDEVEALLKQNMSEHFDQTNNTGEMLYGGFGGLINDPGEVQFGGAEMAVENKIITPWLPIIIVPAVLIAAVISIFLIRERSGKRKH